MAINCVAFPTAIDYQYFVFSSYTAINRILDMSQFLITLCQDNTTIRVRPSQPHTHPSWVKPSVQRTLSQEESLYRRLFHRFDTLMLSNDADLTGTIITSDKPLSVFSGGRGISDIFYFVEQIPPYPTYGNLFFLAPFDMQIKEMTNNADIYRIGSVSDEVSIQINCPCFTEQTPVGINGMPLSGSDSSYTAIINRGEYVECVGPQNNRTFCSIESTRPVTVMSYHFGFKMDSSLFSLLMVYTPPTESYLTRYSLPSLPDDLSLSYTLQESYYELNTPGLLVNRNAWYLIYKLQTE